MRYVLSGHPSDSALVRAIDRELFRWEQPRLERHLASCAACRERLVTLRSASAVVDDACDAGWEAERVAALRDRLGAGIASEGSRSARRRLAGAPAIACGAAVAAALAAVVAIGRVWPVSDSGIDESAAVVDRAARPIHALTPGATRPATARELCAARAARADAIPVAVRSTVLRDYRMESVPADEYELDYLITPELGGATDARNLWPERYHSGSWNALVKDELERYLVLQVCSGALDLETAQRDIAADWIGAYKKYFHTSHPVGNHPAGRMRDDDGGGPVIVARLRNAMPVRDGDARPR